MSSQGCGAEKSHKSRGSSAYSESWTPTAVAVAAVWGWPMPRLLRESTEGWMKPDAAGARCVSHRGG
jgi:hypothetical protein